MDYLVLASEFMKNMLELNRVRPHKSLDAAMQGELFVLLYLAERNTEILPGEISAEMNVSSARVAQSLNGLEKKGWITRKIDAADRRRILVNLTPAGLEEAQAHTRHMIETTADMLALLGEDDAREYVRIIGKLAQQTRQQARQQMSKSIITDSAQNPIA